MWQSVDDDASANTFGLPKLLLVVLLLPQTPKKKTTQVVLSFKLNKTIGDENELTHKLVKKWMERMIETKGGGTSEMGRFKLVYKRREGGEKRSGSGSGEALPSAISLQPSSSLP